MEAVSGIGAGACTQYGAAVIDLAAKLADHGIRPKSFREGDHKLRCPQCSDTRKNKSDPCLSLKIDTEGGATWNCHNGCGFQGNVPSRQRDFVPHATPKNYTKPKPTGEALSATAIQWFAKRGISEETLARYGVKSGLHWMPAAQADVQTVQFPYRRNGEVVNVKYRAQPKSFTQVKGAEKILYGLDDIAGHEIIHITEGEIDTLSFAEIGITNVASVPDGAPKEANDGPIIPDEDTKFSYLWNCREELKAATKIILACDADGPGQALTEELARRLGRERCWRVTWPAINDAQRNDANEVLMEDGPDVLRECIEAAMPYPIKSLHDLGTFESETVLLYRDGPKRAFSTGWDLVDKHMKIREGELSVVTGLTGTGKSEIVDAVTMNLAVKYGWRFAMCSFENPPAEHIAKLAEKYLGQPFWDGPTPRMGEGDLRGAIQWLRDHFYLIRADDESPTIGWLLETAKAAVMRYGIRGLVIDPWNEIEHKRPSGMSETEFVSETLGKVKRFAQGYGCHVWFVAHPAKMYRDKGKTEIPIPNLYDISGSANWANKCDLGVVVHRPDFDKPITEIHIKKVRFKQLGRTGVVTLHYDRATGRYSEKAPTSPRFSMA